MEEKETDEAVPGNEDDEAVPGIEEPRTRPSNCLRGATIRQISTSCIIFNLNIDSTSSGFKMQRISTTDLFPLVRFYVPSHLLPHIYLSEDGMSTSKNRQ